MKSVVITGANAGIGFAAAQYIAGHPDWHVVLACRNRAKAEAAVERIRQRHPGASVCQLHLDLLSLDCVRSFPATFERQGLPPLEGLVLNAGGINMKATSLEFSEVGFEKTFQLNFFAHFVLADLLAKKMRVPSRIVFVSSDLHDPAATRMGKIDPPRFGPVEDAARGRGLFANLKPMGRYATAKMFAMMCALELDRRLRAGHRFRSASVNLWSPGVVPTTQAGRDMPAVLRLIMMSAPFVKFMGSHVSTEDEAAFALGRLIVADEFEGVSGRYFDGTQEILSSNESRDEAKARVIWEQASKLAGMTVQAERVES